MSKTQYLVRDIIVQTTVHDLRVSDEVFRNEPPVDERIELGENLWIGTYILEFRCYAVV